MLIKGNPAISYKGLMESLDIKRNTLAKRIQLLKEQGILIRHGGAHGGKWEINETLYFQFYPQE